MMRIILVLVGIAMSIQLEAQRKSNGTFVKAPATICYLSTKNSFTSIEPKVNNASAKGNGAQIKVTYDGFTTEAQAAFQEAVNIWQTLLESDVIINVEAHWAPLGTGVLGSAGPSAYVSDFKGAPKQNVLYPIALAEKIAGTDLNTAGQADIVATFNSTNNNWHYGLTGSAPPAGTYDLVSIVLHEIGHGLGITHGYAVDGSNGVIPDFFNNQAVAYEVSIIDANSKNLVTDFTPPSAALKTAMTTSLLYSAPLVRAANNSSDAVLYTPSTYSAGSSIAHLDEDTYGPGTANSLMTPFIGAAERILDPGPIIKSILKDMGWISTALDHTKLKTTENTAGPYTAIVKIRNTNGYDASSVKLSYKTTGSFIVVPMTPTTNADEYKANIPGGSVATYSYYISVKDNDARTFTNPGTFVKPGTAPSQGVFVFDAGPDTKPPVITHTPKEFITTNESLEVKAVVTDNLSVKNVKVQWDINGNAQTDKTMTLVANTESTYTVTLTAAGLQDGDKINYRIRAEDNSTAANVAWAPSSTGLYSVNVVGLGTTQDSYNNNFDDLSTADFFGNGFTVSRPSGFTNGAIHSSHPYPAAGDASELNLIYNLKTPVRISSVYQNAILKFDEIVLVEPGEDGSVWPNSDFYDYVVVEGSIDGGITWTALASGYDCRANSVWLTQWNATSSSGNSTASGVPSAYRSHSFYLHDKFKPGDEVAFRFRLYSDAYTYGWGWSIDNLKIQIDDTPPVVDHQHIDFILDNTTNVPLTVTSFDANGLSNLYFDYSINTGDVSSFEIPLTIGENTYIETIQPAALGLKLNDELHYRFRSIDTNGNVGTYPATGYITAPVITLSSPVTQISSDFSNGSPDFYGNFFYVARPVNFDNGSMNTDHPYLDYNNGANYMDYSFVAKKAIKVNADNPMIYYQDIALVAYNNNYLLDYVTVEASKDGITWEALIDPYNANSSTDWQSAFDSGLKPTPSLYHKHLLNITKSGTFKSGDAVLVRFRFHSVPGFPGWGWMVDDISIQGSVTAVEPTFTNGFDAWPNPVTNGSVHVTMALPSASQVNVEFLTMQGQVLSNDRFSAPSGDFQRDYDVNWPQGFYLVRVSSEYGTAVKKIIKLN